MQRLTRPASKRSDTEGSSHGKPSATPRSQVGLANNLDTLRSLGIRAKLTVSAASDPEEREADQLADAFADGQQIHRACAAGSCDDETIHRSAAAPVASAPAGAPRAPPGLHGGAPLAPKIQRDYERFFDADLSAVRIHTAPEAAALSHRLGARAFTVGSQIAFASGEYAPDTEPGRKLLAHELTHVVQSPRAVHRKPDLIAPSGALSPSGLPFLGLPQAKGIQGPLPPGEVVEQGELRLWQRDEHNVRIDYGNSWLTIASRPGQKYEFYLEPTRQRTSPTIPGGLTLIGFDEPAPQVAVRIAATYDVRIDHYQDQSPEAPQLAVHQRYAPADEVAEDAFIGAVRELWDGDSVVISVDQSAIKISPPSDRSDLNPQNFEGAKFAYWIDPVWSGPDLKEKKVTIVASPGVGLQEGEPGMFNPRFSHDRRIVPDLIRVPHPAMVPAQGEPITAEQLVGYARISPSDAARWGRDPDEASTDDLLVATSFSGVTIVHPYSNAKVTIAPVKRDVGAAYAYQVLAAEGGHPGEIRIVVGPGVWISVEEPAPRSWRERFGDDTPLPPGEHPSWFGTIQGVEPLEGFRDQQVEVNIVEVPYADQVPLQGTPLNVGMIGSRRQPDAHEWIDTSDIASTVATTALDVGVGAIPIVGDLVDIGEFVWALATDRDRWGRKVSTSDKVLMGIGAIIGLIPLLGGVGSLLRGGGRAAVKIAEAAASVGKSADELELILWQLRNAVKPGDSGAVSKFVQAVRRGEDLAAEEVEELQALLRRVGASDLAPAQRTSLALPAGALAHPDNIVDLRFLPVEVGADWRRTLNAETRAFLQTAPEVSKVYENMDDAVRAVLTKCASFCLPPVPPTLAQQEAIKRFLTVANPSADETQLIRTFLHKASNLDDAIRTLSEIPTPNALRRFLARNVDTADAALLARDAWRAEPGFEAMRQQARALVADGMSVDQLNRIMTSAARAGDEGSELLGIVHRLWQLKPRPAGADEVLAQLATGGAQYRSAEWALRYVQRAGKLKELKAFELVNGQWAARIEGQTVQFRSWQRFDSEEFIARMAEDYAGGRAPKTRWVFDPGSPLGTAEDIQYAGRQALEDALRRGDPRVTREMIDGLDDMIARIEVPEARKFGRLDPNTVESVLSGLEARFPILADHRLDVGAVQRVISKGPKIDAIKGQLLEELMAASIRRSLETPAGRRALGLGGVRGDLVFIEGHRISLGGRQLTDGVIAVRRGDKLEILVVLEAKSGRGSAGGLAWSAQTVKRMSKGDKLELFNFIRDEYPKELQDYLASTHPDVAKLFKLTRGEDPRLIVQTGLPRTAKPQTVIEKVEAIHDAIPDDVLVDVALQPQFRRSADGWIKVTEEGGQVRRDVERLHEARAVDIDGKATEVVLSPTRTQLRGVVPQDVDLEKISTVLGEKGAKYAFKEDALAIDAQQLIDLAEAMNTQLRPKP